jgi:hypothetical protein
MTQDSHTSYEHSCVMYQLFKVRTRLLPASSCEVRCRVYGVLTATGLQFSLMRYRHSYPSQPNVCTTPVFNGQSMLASISCARSRGL